MADTIRVLHVDDDRDFLDTAAAFLERESEAISAVTATSAEEGRRLLANGDVDCVVSDYQMPGTDGLEFLEAVREDHPDLPFVLFTGRGSEEIASEAISAGVTDYLQKGTGTDQFTVLANRVTNAVEHYRAERALRESEGRYRSVVEQGHDAIYIIGEDGLLFVNERACELSGYSEAELFEMDVEDLIHPEDRRRVTSMGSVHETPEEFEGTFQNRIVTADGEVRHVEFTVQPISYEGERAVLGSVRDVTDRKRAEERFRAFIEHSSDVLTLLDADGTVLYQSPTVERVLGYGPGAMVGDEVSEYIHPDDRDALAGAVDRLLDDPDYSPTVTHRVRHADGSWRVIESRGRNHLEDPAIGGLLFNSRDVTERRRRETDLERYETVVEAVGDPVYAADAEGRFTFVNEALESMSGYAAEELLGEHVSLVIDEQAAERGAEIVRDLLGPGPRTNATLEMTAVTKDGKRVPCETHMAVLPHDGEFRGTAGVVRDITDRRRIERQLRSERDRFATLFENIPDPAVEYEFVDGEPIVRSVNAAFERMFGYEAGTIEGESIDDFIVGESHREEARRLNDEVARGNRLDVEVRRLTADGLRDFMLRNVPLEAEAGVAGYAIYTDITDRKRHERELEWQNERLEEFASVVSHDLRNPLNVARGALELYGETGDDDHLGKVERAHDRMERIIEDVLSLARQRQTVDEPESVDLAGAVEDAWANVETGEAALAADCDGAVAADPNRLRQLFENLFRNAVEHGGDGVTVRAGGLDDGFYVEDDGVGIPESEQDAVFESAYSTSREGAGFGLAIVQRIAEAHGWVVSLGESDDGGARFEVTGVDGPQS